VTIVRNVVGICLALLALTLLIAIAGGLAVLLVYLISLAVL
jgi:hypothetical protein